MRKLLFRLIILVIAGLLFINFYNPKNEVLVVKKEEIKENLNNGFLNIKTGAILIYEYFLITYENVKNKIVK